MGSRPFLPTQLHVFRTHARLIDGGYIALQAVLFAAMTGNTVGGFIHAARHDVDLRTTNEVCHKQIIGILIQRARRTNLHDPAILQDHDFVRQCHRLNLVMGHINHSGAENFVQFGNFKSHLHGQGSIQTA